MAKSHFIAKQHRECWRAGSAALVENWGSVPSAHMLAHNCLVLFFKYKIKYNKTKQNQHIGMTKQNQKEKTQGSETHSLGGGGVCP